MRLFEAPAPRLYNLPAGKPFAREFAEGVLARLRAAGGQPHDLADLHVVVSTRRAIRSLRRAFAEAAGGVALGPRMTALGDIDAWDMDGAEPLEDALDGALVEAVAPAVGGLTRFLFLADLVRALLKSAPALGAATAAPKLAADLAALLDSAGAAGRSLDDLEAALDADRHAAHWALSAQFLDIVRQAWPARLAELGRLDPWDRRRRMISRLEVAWAAAPPATPVIVAGSTGSMETSAWLIELIAKLPQGAVVLPGLDDGMDAASEAAAYAAPEHPQHGLLNLVRRLGATPAEVRPWRDAAPAPAPARRRLLSEALRPAPATDAWRTALPEIAALAPQATAAMTLVEAPDRRLEAAAIAVALREALETPGATAALVTPDRTLARRVAAELSRWRILPDDSSGRPLGLTPPGVFFRATFDAAAADVRPAALLSLLKHPLAAFGAERGLAARRARRFERDVLRVRSGPMAGWAALRARVAERDADAAVDEEDALAPWFETVDAALAPLAARLAGAAAPLPAWVSAHRRAAEAAAADVASASGELYRQPAGEALSGFLEGLEAEPAGGDLDAADYAALLGRLIAGEAVREPYGRHARIKIYGPLEARMLSADRVIVAGLVDGVWPKPPEPDAWLSRDMLRALGLPPLEARVGLSAHDFQQAASAPEVILTRALKLDGAPTTPSRWLARLDNLLTGAALDALAAMRARGQRLLTLAQALDPPRLCPPAPRPCPKPPVAARPLHYSATDIEKLIRDPYAIYAKRVLRLRPTPSIPERPGARDRGELLHALMERFAAATRDGVDARAGARYDEIADAVTGDLADWPTEQAFWRARIARMKPVVLAAEAARRVDGRPAALETRGAMRFDCGLGEVLLTATADRIDALREGGYAIYDYKSKAPTDKQVAQFAKQLPLEAAILRDSGFADAPPGETRRLAYLELNPSYAEKGISAPDIAATAALEGLRKLLSAYALKDQGYMARSRPEHLKYSGDYDPLARYGEWLDGAASEAPR